MRYIGIMVMAASVICFGFFAAQKRKERLEMLCLFRQMICCLKTRILYSNDTLPDALMEVGRTVLEQQDGAMKIPGELFVRIGMRLEQDRELPASKIWIEELSNEKGLAGVSKEDRKSLLELGMSLGISNRLTQEQTIQFYLERTEDSIERLKTDVDARVKLYRSLGIAAGLFLTVCLV